MPLDSLSTASPRLRFKQRSVAAARVSRSDVVAQTVAEPPRQVPATRTQRVWRRPAPGKVVKPLLMVAGGLVGSGAVLLFFPPLLALTLPLAAVGLYLLVKAFTQRQTYLADFSCRPTELTGSVFAPMPLPAKPSAPTAAPTPTPSSMPRLPPAVAADAHALPEVVANYLREMGQRGTWGSTLEAEALSRLHGVRVGIWAPDGDKGFRRVCKTNAGERHPRAEFNIALTDDTHFQPMVNVRDVVGEGASTFCQADRIDAGGDGDCLFLSMAYFLEPADNSPIRDLANAGHDSPMTFAAQRRAAAALRNDLNMMAHLGANAGDYTDSSYGDLCRALHSALAAPYRKATCRRLAQPDMHDSICAEHIGRGGHFQR